MPAESVEVQLQTKNFIYKNEARLHTYILYAQDKCLLKKTLSYEIPTYINSSATTQRTNI